MLQVASASRVASRWIRTLPVASLIVVAGHQFPVPEQQRHQRRHGHCGRCGTALAGGDHRGNARHGRAHIDGHRGVHRPVLDPLLLAEHRPGRPRPLVRGLTEHNRVHRHPDAHQRRVPPAATPHRHQHERRAGPPGPRAPRVAVPGEHCPFHLPPPRQVLVRFRAHHAPPSASPSSPGRSRLLQPDFGHRCQP